MDGDGDDLSFAVVYLRILNRITWDEIMLIVAHFQPIQQNL